MFDLEKAIAGWKRGMQKNPSIEESDLAELERYLRDKIDDFVGAGLEPEDAFRRVEAEFVNASGLDAAYGHARAARPGRRFPWRPGGFDFALLRSNVRVAFRRMVRQKSFSLINIGGLALGLAVCLFVFLWVKDEIGYDRFHENGASLAQVYSTFEKEGGDRMVFTGSFYPLAETLRAECPEVVEAARISIESGFSIRAEERVSHTDAVALADPSLFKMFTFPFLKGNPETALADKYAVVLTEGMARKYFPDQDPIGRTLRVNGQFDVRVSAVIRNVPAQSSLRFDAVVNFSLQFAPSFQSPTHWGGNPLETWIRFSPGADLRAVTEKITAIVRPHFEKASGRIDFHLLPLLRKRLHDPEGPGLFRMIFLLSGAALFVLALACANFTNLSTARAATRAKETGVRKAVGARKSDLVRQFLGESLGTAFLAFVVSLFLVLLLLPVFNRIVGKALSFAAVLTPSTLLGCLIIAGLAGLAAGAYPALALASFRPGDVLSARKSGEKIRSGGLRKALVVFQFALSLVLVLITAVIGRQLSFIKSKDLGFDRRDLVVLGLGPALAGKFEAFRSDLLGHSGIAGVTASLQNPININSTVFAGGVDWPGKDPASQATLNWDYVDFDYFETLKAEFAAGRPFSREFASDLQGAFVVNETAARLMGLPDPVGRKMRVFRQDGTIVGVVKDFHFQPLRTAIAPIVFGLRPSARSTAFIRIVPGTEASSLHLIAETVRRFDPDAPADPVFFDDLMLRDQYAVEERLQTVSRYLSATAVFIATIGLFGLASFLTRRRTKEVGIRKVLGASAAGLTVKLSLEFLLLVAAAGLLACPVAYVGVRKLMGMYAYRAPVGIGLFGLGILSMLAMAALAVGLETVRAARANPVDSLRYE